MSRCKEKTPESEMENNNPGPQYVSMCQKKLCELFRISISIPFGFKRWCHTFYYFALSSLQLRHDTDGTWVPHTCVFCHSSWGALSIKLILSIPAAQCLKGPQWLFARQQFRPDSQFDIKSGYFLSTHKTRTQTQQPTSTSWADAPHFGHRAVHHCFHHIHTWKSQGKTQKVTTVKCNVCEFGRNVSTTEDSCPSALTFTISQIGIANRKKGGRGFCGGSERRPLWWKQTTGM